MEHTNRKGDRYFVFEGKTKTGKPKFFVSRKPSSDGGNRVDSLPEDFELFEDPSSHVVTVRRRRPTRIKQFEADLVHDLAIKLSSHTAVQTMIDGDYIVLYAPDQDSRDLGEMFEGMLGSIGSIANSIASRGRYTAVMRFKLADENNRLYQASRYCFRSSMEGWLRLPARAAPLETLAKKYLPHIGNDSFYELF